MNHTLRQIRRATAEHYEITEDDLKGPSRQAIFARPRMLAYKISRELTGADYSAIGLAYNGRDHSTIISGIRSISDRQAYQKKLGFMGLKNDTEAIISIVKKMAIAKCNGVFGSTKANSATLSSTRNTKETQ